MQRAVAFVAACLFALGVAAEAPEPQGLQVIEMEEGSGDAIAPGSTAVVHYTGWLYDPAADDGKGRKFDSSVDRGQPFRFPLGAGRVIPPGATLVFDVELLGIE